MEANMLFKKLTEQVQLSKIESKILSEEEKKEIEEELIFGDIVSDLDEDREKVENSDVLGVEKKAEDLNSEKANENNEE